MKQVAIYTVIGLLLCSIVYATFKREFDQFNPLYKKEFVYAVVEQPDKLEKKHSRYRYNLTGYTEEGNKKKITFSASEKLEQDSYVKVLAKGAYTSKWSVIQKEDVPNKALK